MSQIDIGKYTIYMLVLSATIYGFGLVCFGLGVMWSVMNLVRENWDSEGLYRGGSKAARRKVPGG